MTIRISRALAWAAVCLVGSAALPASGQVVIDNRSFSATVRVMSWRDIPFRTVVRQRYDFSCGSAALATLLTYHYNMPTDETQAFAAMWRTGDHKLIEHAGFSLLDMKRYLVSRGLQAEGYRLEMADLLATTQPLIVLLDTKGFKHFVVVKGVNDKTILLGDPVRGLLKVDTREFAEEWKGIVLAINTADQRDAPKFNEASEWRPWTQAPLDQAKNPTIGSITNWLPPVYQITTQIILPNGAGINP